MFLTFLNASSGMSFYAGLQVTLGKLKAKERQEWDKTAKDGNDNVFNETAAVVRLAQYSKNAFMFGAYAGVQFGLTDMFTLYNDVGFSFGSGKPSQALDSITVTIRRATFAEADGTYADNSPALTQVVRTKDTASLKQKWMGWFRTELGLANASIYEPFVGVSLAFSKFESDFNVDGDAAKSDTQLVKKTKLGFGPTFGLRIKINDNLRAKVFGELHYFGKINKSMTAVNDTTKRQNHNGTASANNWTHNSAAEVSVKPMSWKAGLAVEYKF